MIKDHCKTIMNGSSSLLLTSFFSPTFCIKTVKVKTVYLSCLIFAHVCLTHDSNSVLMVLLKIP